MEINIANLSIFVIFGIPLIAQYIWLASGGTGLSQDELWGNSSHLFRKISIVTILLSFISGIYLFYYLTFRYCETQKYSWLSMVGLTLVLAASNFWIPSMRANSKIGNILTFFVVSIGSMFVLSSVILDCSPMDIQKIVAILSSSILLFQTFIMDLIIYNLYSFSLL